MRLMRGDPVAAVARSFHLAPRSVARHKARHLAEPVEVALPGPAGDRRLDDLDGRLVELEGKLSAALERAERSANARALVDVAREIRMTVETIARLRHQLNDAPTINVLALPSFADVSGRLLAALLPWPDARAAAAAALSAPEASSTVEAGA